MEKLLGMALALVVILIGVITRESLLERGPAYYLFPIKEKGGISYSHMETSDLNYLPHETDTFVIFAVSRMQFYTIELCSKNSGKRSLTTVSKVNFATVNKSSCAIFYDNGFLHVLTPINDTLVYVKNQINWLPESARIKGDSVVLANDTARVTVPVYAK